MARQYKTSVDFRVLFVSQTGRVDNPNMDPSVRYRCFNPAEVFREKGVLADVVAQQRLVPSMLDQYDAFVFHRPYGGDVSLKICIDRIRSSGRPCVADYDDLIFDPEYALQSSIFLNGVRDEEQTIKVFNENLLGFELFSSFTVSTTSLAKHVQALAPEAKVTVIPNGLSAKLLRTLDIRENGGFCPRKWITYLSGTASHNPDFAFVAPTLAEFVNRHPEFRVVVAGPLELPEDFPSWAVMRLPLRPYREFFTSAGIGWVNIAPLKPENAFNECKSALKFFESGIWGVPTIASPLPDFTRFADSEGLAFATSPEDWMLELERFADDGVRQDASLGLPEYCRRNCMAEASAMMLLDLLKGDCA